MPIYEYRCEECDKKFEVLHKSSVVTEDIFMPELSIKQKQKTAVLIRCQIRIKL